MERFLQAAVLGVLTVILTTLFKQKNADLALLLTLAGCVIIGILLVQLAEPVVSFLSRLRNLAGLDAELMTPMLKTVGIGILTQIGANICSDAGENAIGRLIEVCGGILALYVALPLLEAVIDTVETMAGGY